MGIFSDLRRLRQAQKRIAPFLRTLEDLDIVLEIGAAQEARDPIGTNLLLAAKVAPRATVSRRLARLKKLGVVRQRPVSEDRRRSQLLLDASVKSAFENMLRSIR
jgi:DNA-binding MarR family transcriptional regulator